MFFQIVTIFPQILNSYFREAQIKRAKEKKKIKIRVHDLRAYTTDKHRTVDDLPYGGGAGMVMKPEPIFRCVETILQKSRLEREKTRIILLSAKGKPFNQKKAKEYAKKYKQLIFVCGRYEGVDERVAKFLADEEVSVGPYVLSGGELGAAVIIDAVTRIVPGVVGNVESLKEESHENDSLEYPQYTRPEEFRGLKVPQVLLSGDHKKIAKWRKKKQKKFLATF